MVDTVIMPTLNRSGAGATPIILEVYPQAEMRHGHSILSVHIMSHIKLLPGKHMQTS